MERAMVKRTGVGATARIVQHRELMSARVCIDMPTIILVRHGRKLLRAPEGDVKVEAGMVIAVNGGQSFDVINTPSSDNRFYEAEWLVCDPDIIARFAEGEAVSQPVQTLMRISTATSPFHDAFDHARDGMIDRNGVPHKVAIARVVEMLTWLDHNGGHFRNGNSFSLARKVRLKLNQDVGANWTAPALAELHCMSEATLRRKLAEEGTSFNELLIDVRMSRALTLLQVTDLPVTQVAFETGYESPSRFSARFRNRFGFCPSDVRSPPNTGQLAK